MSNTIVRVEDGNNTYSNCDEILNFISDYYENIYKSPPSKNKSVNENAILNQFLNSNNVNHLNDNERDFSDITISEQELLATLKTMKNGASPGLDGLPIETYKVFWQDIKYFLINCYHECFQNKELTPSQSTALLCLLHKGGTNPRESMSGWRPISLLNADYKLITKLLYRRLSHVTD